MPIQPGDVFRPRAVGSHTHIIISAVTPEGKVLTVNWTTLDAECLDDACILRANEHEDIRHDSSIAYSRAELRSAAKMNSALAAGLLEQRPRLSPEILRRVVQGGLDSRELRADWKALLPKL